MFEGSRALVALAAAVAVAWPLHAGATTAQGAAAPSMTGTAAPPPRQEDEALRFAQGVLRSNDHRQRPFAVVDKRRARLVLFAGDGRVLGAAPVLLGLQPGDHAVPGVGSKPLSAIRREERTTPAGRFDTEPGRNLAGEALVWMDYDAGLALHRVRPGASHQARLQRLSGSDPAQRRVSLGCVVVDAAFYVGVVEPVLGRQRGVVYVLPEDRPLQAVFGDRPQLLALDTH